MSAVLRVENTSGRERTHLGHPCGHPWGSVSRGCVITLLHWPLMLGLPASSLRPCPFCSSHAQAARMGHTLSAVWGPGLLFWTKEMGPRSKDRWGQRAAQLVSWVVCLAESVAKGAAPPPRFEESRLRDCPDLLDCKTETRKRGAQSQGLHHAQREKRARQSL
jgi:hypothetical protein